MDRKITKNLVQAFSFLVLLGHVTPSLCSQAQTPPSDQKVEKSDKAVRAGIGYVQTDVLVFDRQGRFADGLKRDQFELLVDGKPQPISFFEVATAGSAEEAGQWARAQGMEVPGSSQAAGSNPDGGRALFFFLDDLHMSADSIKRVREALSRFVDGEMGGHDRAAFVAASRQIGFMQQLSNDKAALRTALEHLTSHRARIQDNQPPAMSEAQALAIEQNDESVVASFVDAMLTHQSGKVARQKAELVVRRRAAALAKQSVAVTETTLFSLSDLLRTEAELPGRKVVFVLSDGFILNGGSSDATDQLLQITEAAARAGIVIYALDTGGPGIPVRAPTGSRPLSSSGETLSPANGPRVLTAATGGRFLQNAGALDESVVKTLAETSRYYLLGWRVEPTMLQSGNSKSLKVTVRDHPEFTVRLRQTSIDLSRYIWAESKPAKDAEPYELLRAIRNPSPLTALPTFVYAGYSHNATKGQILQLLVQIAYEPIVAAGAPQEESSIAVMGAILDKAGATADFFQSSIPVPTSPTSESNEKKGDLIRSRSIALDPGVYQILVAARDRNSGRTGSASEWIEVPPFVPGKLFLSSIYVLREAQAKEASPSKPSAESLPEMTLSARRSFPAQSKLSFSVVIYDAVFPSDGSAPKVSARVRVLRGDQAVIESSLQLLPLKGGSAAPIEYKGSVSLKGLAAGAYALEVTAIDQSNNSTATQHVLFWIQ